MKGNNDNPTETHETHDTVEDVQNGEGAEDLYDTDADVYAGEEETEAVEGQYYRTEDGQMYEVGPDGQVYEVIFDANEAFEGEEVYYEEDPQNEQDGQQVVNDTDPIPTTDAEEAQNDVDSKPETLSSDRKRKLSNVDPSSSLKQQQFKQQNGTDVSKRPKTDIAPNNNINKQLNDRTFQNRNFQHRGGNGSWSTNNYNMGRPPVIPSYIPQGAHINPAFLAKLNANNNMMNGNPNMNMGMGMNAMPGMGINNSAPVYNNAYPRPYGQGRYHQHPRPQASNYHYGQSNEAMAQVGNPVRPNRPAPRPPAQLNRAQSGPSAPQSQQSPMPVQNLKTMPQKRGERDSRSVMMGHLGKATAAAELRSSTSSLSSSSSTSSSVKSGISIAGRSAESPMKRKEAQSSGDAKPSIASRLSFPDTKKGDVAPKVMAKQVQSGKPGDKVLPKPAPAPTGPPPPGSKVTLTNLSADTTAEDLVGLTTSIGPIREHVLNSESSSAEIVFGDADKAKMFRRKYHKSMLKGSIVSVNIV